MSWACVHWCVLGGALSEGWGLEIRARGQGSSALYMEVSGMGGDFPLLAVCVPAALPRC